MPDHDGNRTFDLWNTSPIICQLRYASSGFKSLVLFTSMQSANHNLACDCGVYLHEYLVPGFTLCPHVD